MELIKNYIYSQVAAKNLTPDEALKLLQEVFTETPAQDNGNEVAIIGLACRLPGADNKEEFWQLLESGTHCIRDFPSNRRRDTDIFFQEELLNRGEFYNQGGYLTKIDEFDASFFRIPPKEAELMDPAQRIFLETAWEAIEDAGFSGAKIYGSRTGIFVGKETTGGSDYSKLLIENNPLAMTGVNTSILASRLAYIFNLKGPCLVVDTACSSSMVALHMAYRAVVDGDVNMAIAGGVAISFLPLARSGMIESAAGTLCAFDKKADGTVWGEGFGVVLLKPLSQALRDKNHIYAVIKGSAINNDGASNGLTAPSAEAQADVIQQALKRAKIDPETVSYIEAHGTGTKLGDPIEIEGINLAYSQYTDKKQFCGIGTVKTNIGHLVGASGLAGLIKMALALQNKKLPASLNFCQPNPFINFLDTPVYLNDHLTEWRSEGIPRRCAVNSFGFSGTNCHVILEEAPVYEEVSVNEVISVIGIKRHIFTLSAKTEDSFRHLLRKYVEFLTTNPNCDLGSLCYTVNTGRGHYNYRLAVLCDNLPFLIRKLTSISSLSISELEEHNGIDIFFGKHLVVVNQKKKGLNEIFEVEKLELSDTANQLFRAMVNEQSITTGLEDICRFYIQGADIVWEVLYPDGAYQTLSLPSYQFDRKRYWSEFDPSQVTGVFNNSSPDPPDTDFYYNIGWISEQLKLGSIIRETGILVLNDSSGMGETVAQLLKDDHPEVIIADLHNEFRKIDRDHYWLTGSQEDYEQLFKEIQTRNISLILHMHSITDKKEFADIEQFNHHQKRGVWSLYYLTKAILNCKMKNELQLMLITNNVNDVTGQESKIIPENAPLFGLAKVIGMEYPNLKCRCLDIDETITAKEIIKELTAVDYTFITAYRTRQRYAQVMEKIDMAAVKPQKITIKDNGVYVITGGTGGIGLEIGKYLAKLNRVNLALINRSKLPDYSEWDNIIVGNSNRKLANKLQQIKSIEQNGSKVTCYSADVSNPEEIARILKEIRTQYGNINGIIHSAGIAGDGFIIRKDDDVFRKVLAPKVQGTWILDNLTHEDQMDFMVLFSSIASLFGGMGQGDYTAANSYLDSFTTYRNKQGKKTLTINWPAWKETGMAVDFGVNQDSVIKAIKTAQAINCFAEVLNSNLTRVIIGAMNYRNPGLYLLDEDQSLFRLSDEISNSVAVWKQQSIQQPTKMPKKTYDVEIMGKEDGVYTETEIQLARIWGNALGVNEINVYDDFYELGGDSILAIQIINDLNEVLTRKSSISELFECANIAAFAAFIDSYATESKFVETPELSLPATESTEYDLSDLQQSIWLIQNTFPEMTGYNIPLKFDLQTFKLAELKKTLDLLFKRHAILRTIFVEKDGIPKQIILDDISPAVNVVDLSYEDNKEAILETLLQQRNQQVIDISKPLHHVELFKLAPNKYCFYMNLHHVMVDGWSTIVFYNEFMEIYHAYCNGTEPKLEPVKMRYVDWVMRQKLWLESEEVKETEHYWLRELSKPLPVLNLPVDFERPKTQTFTGDHINIKISLDDTQKIKTLSRECNVTLHTLFSSAYLILLHKITVAQDLIIGIPQASRNDKELENIMGLFLNMICIRVNFSQLNTFKELVNCVKEKSIQAYKYDQYPFNRLVQKVNPERDPGRNPIFSTIFQFSKVMPSNRDAIQVDINVFCTESPDGIEVMVTYNKALFKPQTIAGMLQDYQTILKTVIMNQDIDITRIELGKQYQKNAKVLKEAIEFRF